MTFAVAIPSYRRPEVLSEFALPLLASGGVPLESVTVFLRPDDPTADLYAEKLRAFPGVRTAPAGLGIVGARNSITDHYPDGAAVVCMDDDVRSVVDLAGPVVDLPALFDRAFAETSAADVALWSVAPTANAYFLRPGSALGLWFAHGSLHGVLNDRALRLTVEAKEDYERSLLYFDAYGGSLRLKDVCFTSAPMRRLGGGMQAAYTKTARQEREAAAIGSLSGRWPGLVREKAARDGFREISLRSLTRR